MLSIKLLDKSARTIVAQTFNSIFSCKPKKITLITNTWPWSAPLRLVDIFFIKGHILGPIIEKVPYP